MHESHQNAPTVHGNTADLPTALRAQLASGERKRSLCAPSAYSSVCPG